MLPTRLAIPDLVRAEFSSYFESPSERARAGAVSQSLASRRPAHAGRGAALEDRRQDRAAQRLPRPGAALDPGRAGCVSTRAARRAAQCLRAMFWIGHASFLLELDGARFVVDPIFGRAGGLVPRVTPPAAQPGELTALSAVLVTHGHHDHLDPSSLKSLALANGGQDPVRGAARAVRGAAHGVHQRGRARLVGVRDGRRRARAPGAGAALAPARHARPQQGPVGRLRAGGDAPRLPLRRHRLLRRFFRDRQGVRRHRCRVLAARRVRAALVHGAPST